MRKKRLKTVNKKLTRDSRIFILCKFQNNVTSNCRSTIFQFLSVIPFLAFFNKHTFTSYGEYPLAGFYISIICGSYRVFYLKNFFLTVKFASNGSLIKYQYQCRSVWRQLLSQIEFPLVIFTCLMKYFPHRSFVVNGKEWYRSFCSLRLRSRPFNQL